MKRKKRGISPLIASVLLITFAVIIGAMVINWERRYVKETSDLVKGESDEKIKCGMDVGIKLVEIDDIVQLCYDSSSNNISFTVENIKNLDIEGLRIRVIGNTSIFSYVVPNSTISGSGVLRAQVYYNETKYGGIDQISLIPGIEIEGTRGIIYCPNNAITEDIVNSC